jgi:hypothetical protein
MCPHIRTSALLVIMCKLSHVPIHGLHGIVSVVVIGPTFPRLSRLPSGHGVHQVRPCHPGAANNLLQRRVE